MTPEEIKATVQDMILDHGFVVQYVGRPDCCKPWPTQEALIEHYEIEHEGEPQLPFGYTVGRTLKGRPELLISGLPVETTQQCLTNAVALDDIEPLDLGRPAQAVFDNYLAFPIAIDPWNANMLVAIACFGVVNALQLLWPDDTGCFPGDPDFRHYHAQRVFA